MKPTTSCGSKVEEDPQEFIYEIYNILLATGLSTSEKVELSTYQLKDVSQALFVHWRDNRPLKSFPLTWDICKKDFLVHFFPREMREEMVKEFMNLRQRGRTVHK